MRRSSSTTPSVHANIHSVLPVNAHSKIIFNNSVHDIQAGWLAARIFGKHEVVTESRSPTSSARRVQFWDVSSRSRLKSNIAPVDFGPSRHRPRHVHLHPIRTDVGNRRLPAAPARSARVTECRTQRDTVDGADGSPMPVYARRSSRSTGRWTRRWPAKKTTWTRLPDSASPGTSNTVPASAPTAKPRSCSTPRTPRSRACSGQGGARGRQGQSPAPVPRRAGPGVEPDDRPHRRITDWEARST